MKLNDFLQHTDDAESRSVKQANNDEAADIIQRVYQRADAILPMEKKAAIDAVAFQDAVRILMGKSASEEEEKEEEEKEEEEKEEEEKEEEEKEEEEEESNGKEKDKEPKKKQSKKEASFYPQNTATSYLLKYLKR